MKVIEPKDNKYLNPLYLIAISIVLFGLGNFLNFRQNLNFLGSVFQPLVFAGLESGQKIKSNLNFLADYKKEKESVESLKNRIELLENQLDQYEVLKKRYSILEEHTKSFEKKYRYIQSSFYLPSDGSSIIINVGRNDGIEAGDIAVLGDTFIGVVEYVDNWSAKVVTPYNSKSTLEVSIYSDGKNGFVKAIAVGKNFETIIENISSQTSVKEGDLVFVSDLKVPGKLLLGKVTQLEKDPAASVISAKVKSSVDLNSIEYIYIRK